MAAARIQRKIPVLQSTAGIKSAISFHKYFWTTKLYFAIAFHLQNLAQFKILANKWVTLSSFELINICIVIKKPSNTFIEKQKVESSTLFTSGFYQIKHWGYDFDDDKKINTGFNDCLCIVHVKKGNFYFNLSSQSLDMHSGHVVIEKPNYEYRLRPSTGECSIFNFTDDFYRQFLEDMNMKHESAWVIMCNIL